MLESTAAQRGIGDGREEPLGAVFELVCNPEGGGYVGHEYTLSQHAHRCGEIAQRLGACGLPGFIVMKRNRECCRANAAIQRAPRYFTWP